MSQAIEPQLVDTVEDIDWSDYPLTGDTCTVGKKQDFIREYRLRGNILHGAQAARVGRSTVYKWLSNDPAFVAAVEDSFEDCVDNLEASAG